MSALQTMSESLGLLLQGLQTFTTKVHIADNMGALQEWSAEFVKVASAVRHGLFIFVVGRTTDVFNSFALMDLSDGGSALLAAAKPTCQHVQVATLPLRPVVASPTWAELITSIENVIAPQGGFMDDDVVADVSGARSQVATATHVVTILLLLFAAY